jgi:hypothetical protein
MLDRPPRPDKNGFSTVTVSRRAQRQRAYRQRQRDGVVVIPVPVDDHVWRALRLSNWAHEGDSRAEIGEGIAAALRTLLRS